ncbi:PepSY-associated TM helix domain-containing protein [Oceanobacter mangrovi]|uniref:PepSY-associated TM helix domain-containing protein n=1 Tax=Oceanobacter mangrovi TaxID=2862510 RepID=UPI001C8DE85A|nr:PepSY-associated TM helix domain-containing protein [Oceanobacter mangrovi]
MSAGVNGVTTKTRNGIKVRGELLKMYKSLHTWVGICSGLLLFIGFFAGALTMFEEPIQSWSTPQQHQLRLADQLSTDELDLLVSQVLAEHPAARQEIQINLSSDQRITAPVSWHEAEADHHALDLDGHERQASLSESGELVVRDYAPGQLAELIDQLHRSAGIPGEIGHDILGVYLMGVAAFLYSIALVSGLVLILPTIIRDFVTLRPEKSRKRFWLDAHNLIGLTSLPFHIVIAFSVVVFAFHDQFYGALSKTVYGEQPMFGGRGGQPPVVHQIEQLPPLSELVAKVRQAAPEFDIKAIEMGGLETPRARVRVALSNPDYLTRGAREAYLVMNPYSLEVTNWDVLPGHEDGWSGLVAGMFGIHFGSYGGLPMQWLYFLLGISGAFVFYSGNLLWVESRRKKQQQLEQNGRRINSVRLLSGLTTGVCLGVMAAVAVAMLIARYASLHSSVADTTINGLIVSGYYLVFLGWLVWGLLASLWDERRTGQQMLMVTGLVVLVIPLAGLLSLALGWSQLSLTSVGVELTAMVIGLGLVYGSRRLAAKSAARPLELASA